MAVFSPSLLWVSRGPCAFADSRSPLRLVRNLNSVLDQEKAKSAPLAVQIWQTILVPFGIYIDQPLRKLHGVLVEQPSHCHPEILEVSHVLRCGSMLWVKSLHPQTVPSDHPRFQRQAKIVPSICPWNWSKLRGFFIHQSLHLVKDLLVPPKRWLNHQGVSLFTHRRNQPRHRRPMRPIPG